MRIETSLVTICRQFYRTSLVVAASSRFRPTELVRLDSGKKLHLDELDSVNQYGKCCDSV